MLLRTTFPAYLWSEHTERYLCSEVRYEASSSDYHHMPPLLPPLLLGNVTLTGGVGFHHLSIYRCTEDENQRGDGESGLCTSPTPRGCDEMLFTYTSSSTASLPPRDVSFLPSKRLVLQLHTRRETARGQLVSVSVSTAIAPAHVPVVQFVEIGARRDWGGVRARVQGECPASCRQTQSSPVRVRYLILHSHHAADRNCWSTSSLSSCGFARNSVSRVDVDVGAREAVRLSCTFARPARLGTNSTDQMCFAYALVDRVATWPAHCWTSDTEKTCHGVTASQSGVLPRPLSWTTEVGQKDLGLDSWHATRTLWPYPREALHRGNSYPHRRGACCVPEE